MPMTEAINLRARVGFSIAIGSDVDNAEVNAEEAIDILQLGLFNVASSQEIELPALEEEVRFALARFEKLSLPFAAYVGNLLAASDSPDGHELLLRAPGQYTVIIGDSTVGLKAALLPSIQLVGIGDLGNAADSHLSREPKLLANFVVEKMVKVVLAKSAGLPALFGDVIAGAIRYLKGFLERSKLLVRGLECHGGYQSHCSMLDASSAEKVL